MTKEEEFVLERVQKLLYDWYDTYDLLSERTDNRKFLDFENKKPSQLFADDWDLGNLSGKVSMCNRAYEQFNEILMKVAIELLDKKENKNEQ